MDDREKRLKREAAEQKELDRVMNLGHEPGGVLDKTKPKKTRSSQAPSGRRKYDPMTKTGKNLSNAVMNRKKMLDDL